MAKGEIKRILVRVPNWVGDAVMTLPALDALKALYKGADVTVLARKKVIPVYENNPAVRDIVEYGEDYRGIRGRFKLSGRLKERDFQLAVLFQNAFDAAFISFMSRIPERAGYARDLRGGLLTIPVPFTDEVKRLHHVFYYLKIVEALGGSSPARPSPRIDLSDEEERGVDAFLREKGIAGTPLVGAAPGASFGPAKRWPPERFAVVLTRLARTLNATPIVFGGPEDSDVCAEVFKRILRERPNALNLAGVITLRRFIGIAGRLKVFLTNDSGPMHIAAAVGVPTVAVFGSTDPVLTGPTGGMVRVIIKELECSPCFERKCRYGHYQCLTSITADEVYREAVRVFQGS